MYEVGEIFKNRNNEQFKIIDNIGNNKRRIQFLDSFGYTTTINIGNMKTKTFKNPYFKSVYKVGYFGVGEYKAKIKGKIQASYDCWVRILDRCYNKNSNHKNKTYRNVTVCEEWLNYQNFAKWYNENKPNIEGIRFDIDKDLLQQEKTNKIYSPEYCLFLPKKINVFLCNNQTNNTSGNAGVCIYSKKNKWRAYTSYFGENKQRHLGYYEDKQDAFNAYKVGRVEESEKAKNYLKSLNYLPEEIIQLIK